MARASILKNLSDADLEAIRHEIRRGAHTAREIARMAEKGLGHSLGSDDAAAMAIGRYRHGQEFQRWLQRWENQDAELKRAIAAQTQRYKLITKLVKGSSEGGLETVSKYLQARLLTLAAEANDEELKEAAGGKGWISEALKLAQREMLDRQGRKVEELKAEIKRLMNAPKGKAVSTDDLVAAVDEVMGIKKA